MKFKRLVLPLFVIAIGFILGLFLPYSSSRKTGIEFNAETVDLGVIERDAVALHKLTFKNCFNEPVWIESIKRSCGCLAPDFSTQPIAPGESGEILVKLDAKQGVGKRNGGIVKNLTVKFGPVDLEKVVTVRASPLDDVILDLEEIGVNAERKATNQIKIERGFLSEDEFKKLSIDVPEGSKAIISARNSESIEFAVSYHGRDFAPNDLVLLKYKKKQEEIVKWLRLVEDKTGMPELRPLNYFKSISKNGAIKNLKTISITKFALNDGDKKIEILNVFFRNDSAAKYFECAIDRDAKNEFAIFLTLVPESSLNEEAVVEFVELDSAKKRSRKLPIRVFVQTDDF